MLRMNMVSRRRLPTALLVILIAGEVASADDTDFVSDWKFSRTDAPEAAAPDFNDSDWLSLRLPHDWAIAGPFDRSALSGYSGKLPWQGVGWYRKSFTLPVNQVQRVYLDFDGVMAFPQVYVNGKLVGEWDYGYTPFCIDATDSILAEGKNSVAVRVDTRQHGTRWYPGAGLYRKVALRLTDQVHFAHHGLFVTTPKVGADSARVLIVAECENHRDAPVTGNFEVEILDPQGGTATQATRVATFPPGGSAVSLELEVLDPQLWDVGVGKLYSLRASLKCDEGSRDEVVEGFGIRTIELTDDDGLHVNGRRVQLHGVNLHHDHGPLGAAFFPHAMERQLLILIDMGVNAIRTSHNPPAEELLDLCDHYGVLVWDECFDKWDHTADRVGPQSPDHRTHAERHLGAMVRRDRNHPSVFCWSIGNELSADAEGLTPARVKMMREMVLSYDPTRPVGMGCHIPEYSDSGMFDSLDFTGWNYARRYERFHSRRPDKPIIYSESASAISTRGFYELPLPVDKVDYSKDFQVDSYDFNAAPWSDIADREFALMEQDRFVAGEFVWTGFDYLGEPTPFDRQARSSYFGIVDLCGIPKDRFWLYRSHWRPKEPTVHLVPHWNWPGCEGRSIPVVVYTNGDEAELFVNGNSAGRRRKGERPALRRDLVAGKELVRTRLPISAQKPLQDDASFSGRADLPRETVEIDLDRLTPIRSVSVRFSQPSREYACVIETLGADDVWRQAASLSVRRELAYYDGREVWFRCDAEGRRLRVAVLEAPETEGYGIAEIQAFATPTESEYYSSTYDFRLRWDEVPYDPGEIRVIAYRQGRVIGEAVRHTAGPAAKLIISPDRAKLKSDGDDLCYVLVEAVDDQGSLCPLADNEVRFEMSGPATLAGAGNGNPLSYDSFQSPVQKLFSGKAMYILRSLEGREGEINLRVGAAGLVDAKATIRASDR